MITLRPLRESDIDDLVVASNDPLVQLYVPSLPSPYTRMHAEWWISAGIRAVADLGGAVWAIAERESDRLLGSIGLHSVAPGRDGKRAAALGYWVAPWARGRGVAAEATRQATAWAFDQGYPRLELGIRRENVHSQRVALAAGYQYEGVRRAAECNRDGSRHDLLIWSRLPSDPPGPIARLLPDLPGVGLSDGIVTVRPLESRDADDLFALRNLPEVIASHVPPIAPERETIERECVLAPSFWLMGSRAAMVIVEEATGAFAGEIGLYYQEPVTGQAMLGYSAVPAVRGKGYTTRAVNLVADWAFGQVGVSRLIAGSHPDNLGSQRVLAKAGFIREGYQRARLPGTDTAWIDDILWARLPE